VDLTTRDSLVAQFRRRVYATNGITLFPHQADWQLASEGWTLLDAAAGPGDYYTSVLVPTSEVRYGEVVVESRLINAIPCSVVRRRIVPRDGGPAHVLADLAAFKSGKSWSAAAWGTGFACLPNALVQLIGITYSTSEPEFNYLAEFLLSERGMNMKPASYQNDKRGGRMRILLRNGCEFEVKSYEQKEGLKGKKVTSYIFSEAYQLPGLECYTGVSQNLRELRGFALFPTTPDRPWVGTLHDYGHGRDADFHCTCNVDAACNPFTFDQKARDRDDPDKGGLMTREKYSIAWLGKLGSFVGRVYDFNRGDDSRYFSPLSHPGLWKPNILKEEVEHDHAVA